MADKVRDLLYQYKHKLCGTKPNQFSADPIQWKFCDKDINEFNNIYKTLKESDLYIIERAPSGSIRKGNKYIHNRYAWDIKVSKAIARITVCLDGEIWVFRMGRPMKDEEKSVKPYEALSAFFKKCDELNVDYSKYATDYKTGLAIKETIPAPFIDASVTGETNTVENVHHIDFHNSYPAGLANTHPEFKPVIEYFYEKRKENPENKAVLNYTIGCMQSAKAPYWAQYAQLSRDAIIDNNLRIKMLELQLRINGCKILAHNTDGIWYSGSIYHGSGEGKQLGNWEHDYVNCKWRAKSAGIYEFIGTDTKTNEVIYKPVVRGTSDMDLIEPDRSKWQWGDIFKANVYNYKFDEERGIIQYEIV